MIIQLPEDRAAFVAQISEFVDKKYPASLRKKQENRQDFTKSDYKRWHCILAKAGWGACHWPD